MKDNALQIAKTSLKNCYDKRGIVAGRTHFNYYWARDSFYASWGAMELLDFAVVKKNLELFLKNFRSDGLVPIRIGSSSLKQWLSFAGLNLKNDLKPCYSQDKGQNPAIDPNLLLLITLETYAKKTGDKKIIKDNLSKIHLIIDFLEKQERQGLIYGGKYATWQDIIKKKGFVLYTNVLYYQALVSVSNILALLDIKNEFLEKANVIKDRINKKFWNKKVGYYTDFFDEKRSSDVFSSDGNFFAIIFGVADKEQSGLILKKAEKIGISKDVPSYTNYPAHNFREVFAPFYLIGMQDYNDYGVCWTWLGALHAMALFKAGKQKQAKNILEKLASYIIKDKEVYEVYEKTGKPLNRLFYKSEHPFAWSAGFYILAEKMIRR